MDDYEFVVIHCKRLERLLEQGFGARGRGLHEKVTAVQDHLPPSLIRKLRFVATVRNRLLHDSTYLRLDDREGFAQAGSDAESQLNAILRQGFTRTPRSISPDRFEVFHLPEPSFRASGSGTRRVWRLLYLLAALAGAWIATLLS